MLPAPGAPGVPAAASPAPHKDDNRHRSRGEGGRKGGSRGRAGLGAETPTPAGPGSRASETRASETPSPDSRCARRRGAPSPPGLPPPQGKLGRGCRAAPRRAPPPRAPGRDSPAAGGAALSCVGRGEPSPPGAGRRLGAPGRRLLGRRAPSRAGRWLLGGGGGRGEAEGCVPTGATRRGEPSAPVGATFSLSPRPRASAARYRLDPFQG